MLVAPYADYPDADYPDGDYPDADPDWKYVKPIVYWLGDRKLINSQLKKSVQKYKYTFMQNSQCYKCVWGMSVNANEEILAGYADPAASYSDADPDAT